MPIIDIRPPKWIDREWHIEYVVADPEIGTYIQKVHAETLVAAERYIKLLKEQQK